MTMLHRLRRAHGVSLSQLAVRTSIPLRQLAAFEYHDQPLSVAEQQRVADVFGVSASVLPSEAWISQGRPTTPATASVYLSRSMWLLLGMVLLLYLARLMILPFLAVYFTAMLRFSGWQGASILTVMLLCQRALPLVGGLLGDRLSHVRVVFVGLVASAVGVVSFGMFHEFWWLIAGAVLFGAGGAMIDPSINAILAASPPAQRGLIFTRYNQMLNVATMVGPIVGSYLLMLAPLLLFCASGALCACTAALVYAGRHHYPTHIAQETVQHSLVHVWQIRGFVRFLAVMTLFWIMFAQLTVALPLHAFRIGQTEQSVSLLFFVNGLAGVLLLVGLQSAFQTAKFLTLLKVGVACVGLGLSLVPLFPDMVWVLGCVLVYTLGETLVLTSADIAVAEFSSNRHTGAFYGLFDLSWAIGGTLGNYVGTWTVDQASNALWPWSLYGCLGLLTCLLLRYCFVPQASSDSTIF